MTDWCQIAIELYRDGMTKAEIRRKLEITERKLERWLLDGPVRDDFPGRKKASQARKVAVKLLRAGMNPKRSMEGTAGPRIQGYAAICSGMAKNRQRPDQQAHRPGGNC